MTRFLRTDWLLLGLVFLAAAQAVALTARSGSGGPPDTPWFAVGDTLSAIHALDSRGQAGSLAGEGPTVLLVFHSECGHCQEVAPLWKTWTGAPMDGVRVMAISSEDSAAAEAYADEHEWSTEVWTVRAGRLGGPGHTLTSRTPWVFVLDREGVVLTEGHGNRIAELTAILDVGAEETA